MKIIRFACAVVAVCAGCADVGAPQSIDGPIAVPDGVTPPAVNRPSVSYADGLFLQPESVAWMPPRGSVPGLFAVTNPSYPGPVSIADELGWISFFDENGTAWTPIGGFGGPGGWDSNPAWPAQCGAFDLSNPLGIAIDESGRIWIAEGAHDEDGAPSVLGFDLVEADGGHACVLAARIPLPGVLTINDLAFGPRGELYVTDSAFADPAESAIYRITDPDGEAPVVERWLNLSAHPAPNPIVFVPPSRLYVATLGRNLDPRVEQHDGRVLEIRIRPDGASGNVSVVGGLRGMFDGIAYDETADRLRVSDLRSRMVWTVTTKGGAYEPWVDLSSRSPQLGGIGCHAGVCAQAEYRGSRVMMLE